MTINSLSRRFNAITQSQSLESFVPTLYQYVLLITKDANLSLIIKDLDTKKVSDTQNCPEKDLLFLKETEIWPHWEKIKACLDISGKNHHQANLSFLAYQNDDILDFMHFRAGNNSMTKGETTDEQIKNYKTSVAIVHGYLIEQLEILKASDQYEKAKTPVHIKTNCIKSIYLITESVVPKDTIFLVLDGLFQSPIRYAAKNRLGNDTGIKKLHNLAYVVNVQGKAIPYSKKEYDVIDKAVFKREAVSKYMKDKGLAKTKIIQKSTDKKLLVLSDTLIKNMTIKDVPQQYQYLYNDKTR